MHRDAVAARVLAEEARSLLVRLSMVHPFALQQTSVPAAAISPEAQTAIERYLAAGRRILREQVHRYLRWLDGPGRLASAADMQRRFTMLRLGFNVVLAQFDIFSAALTQRSERETGVWLGGLDALAKDGIELPGGYYDPPPVICYLDRGLGAAIRRARTRLPGGGINPVSVIRVPRERMVGGGIAASLLHEVGHQAAALLGLVPSLHLAMRDLRATSAWERRAWSLWERWTSEIVADLWALAHLGIGATLGVMSVVSLPRAFVFRIDEHDPHPPPWLRVKLSCAMGRALFPHAQWDHLERLWERLYPLGPLDPERRSLLAALEQTMAPLTGFLAGHRPRALRGRSLVEALPVAQRQPQALAEQFRAWQLRPGELECARPSLAFAVLGQAKVDGAVTPELEGRAIANLLTNWALESALDGSARRTERARLQNGFANVKAQENAYEQV